MFSADITVLLLTGLVALLAGYVHSAIGFGFGIVAVTLLPLFVDVHQSHVVISTAAVPVLLMAAWAYRDGADLKSLAPALAAAAVCLPIGLWAFEGASPEWLIRGTGGAILVMVGLSFLNRRRASRSDKSRGGSAWFAGALGGFLAGAVSIAGPPVAAYALAQPWDQRRFKAFLSQFLVIVSVYKVIGMTIRGLLDSEVMIQSATLAPMAMIGIQLGALSSHRWSADRFQYLVAAALVGIALYFVLG